MTLPVFLIWPSILVGLILFWVWQYNSVKLSRRYGLPNSAGAGFGVGSWFIPFVNLVLPWLSLSQIVPKENKKERRVLYSSWALTLTFFVLNIVSMVMAAAIYLSDLGDLTKIDNTTDINSIIDIDKIAAVTPVDYLSIFAGAIWAASFVVMALYVKKTIAWQKEAYQNNVQAGYIQG